LFAGDTLIRAVLHMDPDELADEMWAHQIKMSEWFLNSYALPK